MFKRLFLTRNVATWDRVVRVFPALISILAFMQGWISGGLALVMAIVSLMLLITSLTGTCSIYSVLGLSTRRSKSTD